MVENISNEEATRVLGRDAQRNNILAARVVSETVKTTLGPKGMDKMLVDRVGNVTVTNDGVTILSEMEIEHPAAKMIVEVAKTQEKEVGDGTTTAVMLAGKLLENAEKLLDMKIHPTIITRGYRWASQKAQALLEELCVEIDSEEELAKVAQTAMTGKGAEYLREHYAQIIVDAVKIVSEEGMVNTQDIRIEKQKGGKLEDTQLIKGLVLNKGRSSIDMPKKVLDAKIAIIEEALETKTLQSETRFNVTKPSDFQQFVNQEEQLLREKVEILKRTGANVVIVQKGIDALVQDQLARQGIYALSRISHEDLQDVAKATGGRMLAKLAEISKSDLGTAESVEERLSNEEATTHILGCKNPKVITILIRGGTNHVMDETERALKDALGDVASTMKDSKVLAGGGAVEIELAKGIKEFAASLKGRERLAVEEFANAMEFIPTTLAENAGLDPIDVLNELRAVHEAKQKHAGLNLFTGKIEDTMMKGIIEPLKVKTQAITSASEVAIMILRIDDVIAAKKAGGNKGTPGNMGMYD